MNTSAILDAARAHAMALGRFERVSQHEPKNAPGSGLTCAIWADSIQPVAAASGLAATSARLVLMVRVYTSMLAEPQDEIDPAVIAAVDALIGAYHSDFTLGGLVRNVDVLGQHGAPLAAQAGYLNQDNRIFRVMTITLPLIVSDAWTQAP